jgi:ParB family transcriptional regulator, chromosome partitioning protein
MSKNFTKNAEESSIFLVPSNSDIDNNVIKGERADTSPFREARMIDINRIQPDLKQPRRTFFKETLISLAESIKELGGIIDPLTVEYIEKNDCFQIISGERRYRAAKIVGLEMLPCIVRKVDDKKRFLVQFIANLQREDIPPLEETAGIKHLMENYAYTQKNIGKLINKSKSYISQMLGLDRLSKFAREMVQTSELSKEVLIQASREKDPEKQLEILKKANKERKTVRQIRNEQKESGANNIEELTERPNKDKKEELTISGANTFREWTWEDHDRRFVVIIRFNQEHSEDRKTDLIQKSLEEVLRRAQDLNKKRK